MKHLQTACRLVLVIAMSALAPSVWANSAQEHVAHDYLAAAVTGNAEVMVDFYLPGDLAELRTRVLKALDQETASGANTIRQRLFGVATSVEEARRLTPTNLFVTIARRIGVPADHIGDIKVLGVVEENSQSVHAVARLFPPKDSSGRPHVTVVTLVPYGKDWRVALPYWFQAHLDEMLAAPLALAAAGVKAGSTSPAAAQTNSKEIVELLDTGSALLRAGSCATFFTQEMSPKFRASTASKALKTLIKQCEQSIDTRETYIQALEIAKGLAPHYEDGGVRAVYDMKGKGLPFDQYVLEKVDEHWYVAE